MSRALKDYNSINWNALFEYNKDSPTHLSWKVARMGGRWNKLFTARAGTNAGNIHHDLKKNTKYALVTSNGTNWFAHRIIYIMHHGYLDNNLVIDHIDGDSLNNSIENLRAVSQEFNNRNSSMRKDNNSGICGVHFTTAKGGPSDTLVHTYCTATWYEENNKRKCKHFAVSKYGLLPAFNLACEYRKDKIEQLNIQGKDYTKLHGKD